MKKETYTSSSSLQKIHQSKTLRDCILGIGSTANTLVSTSRTYFLYSFCFPRFIAYFFKVTSSTANIPHDQTITSLRGSKGIGGAANIPQRENHNRFKRVMGYWWPILLKEKFTQMLGCLNENINSQNHRFY